MARNNLSCDVCRRPCQKIVAKIYLSPRTGGKSDHANYTAHADIGECCAPDFLNGKIKWQKRKPNSRSKVTT